MNATYDRFRVGSMPKQDKSASPPDKPGRPQDWREQIRADLAAQVTAGATLYGFRRDGVYIARTRYGERVIRRPAPDSS